jgi:LysM repeat protein
MNKSLIRQIVLLLGAAYLLVTVWMPGFAQSENLLQNPGFETPFNTLDGDPPRQVAQGWTPWHVPAAPGSPSFANLQPEYEPTAPETTRILEGSDAQLIRSFFATHDGGVYQRVTGITPGVALQFSVFAYVWSNTFDDIDVSEEDGDVFVQVGIDPTGGTDAQSAAIIWSEPGVEQYDAYNEYVVEAEAEGEAVTVFVRTVIGVPVKNNHIYLDQAALEITGAVDETEEPSATVTEAAPTDTVTPTEEGAEETIEPTAEEPTATDTPEPTAEEATATSTAEPTAEEPEVDPLALTATAIIAQATETAAAALTATASVPEATATEDPIFLTATAIIEAATATAEANLTATAGAVEPTSTETATLTVTATSAPISDMFPATITHVVQSGETVAILAERYGSTVEAIAQANGLDSSFLIRVGQTLVIPVPLEVPVTATQAVTVVTATPSGPVPPLGSDNTYAVRPGDTLSRIARLFNTNVETLAQLNGIVNVDRIQVGQMLQLPVSTGDSDTTPPSTATPTPVVDAGPPQATYVVRPGDSLYRISLLYGVPIARIAQANNIVNANRIYVGQRLIIP